jgi:biopolymer transport protein ExbD
MPPAGRSAPAGLTSEMNVLPLIDVLLVMIVTFLMLQKVRMVENVQIPPPSSSAAGSKPFQLVLEIHADGTVAINGHPIPDDRVDADLAAIYRDRPTKLLFIKADPSRPYFEVIRAIDRAKGAGVEVLALVPRGSRP